MTSVWNVWRFNVSRSPNFYYSKQVEHNYLHLKKNVYKVCSASQQRHLIQGDVITCLHESSITYSFQNKCCQAILFRDFNQKHLSKRFALPMLSTTNKAEINHLFRNRLKWMKNATLKFMSRCLDLKLICMPSFKAYKITLLRTRWDVLIIYRKRLLL